MGSLRGRRIPLTPDGQLGSPSLAVFSFPSGAIPTWTRTASLIAEHAALRDARGGAPSHWALYRFTTKLRAQKPLLDACLGRVLLSLHEVEPSMGKKLAIDATDLPAYANGQKYDGLGPRKKPFSDPDAAWGFRSAVSTRRGGGPLWLQVARCHLRQDGASARMARRERQQAGNAVRAPALGRRHGSRLLARSLRVR
jgi:hypothetical protein